MLTAYPACFFKEDNGYSVIFPDLNYLATCGETLDEAFAMAIDCLAGYLCWLEEDKEDFPVPSAVQDLDPDAIAAELESKPVEAFVSVVTVDVEEYAEVHFHESVRKILTIPAWLNTAALERNINFSQALQDRLKELIGIQSPAAAS